MPVLNYRLLLDSLMIKIEGSQSPPGTPDFDDDLDLVRRCVAALMSDELFRFVSRLYGSQVDDPPIEIFMLLSCLRNLFLEVGVIIRAGPPKTPIGMYWWLLYECRVLEMQGPGIGLRPSFEEDALVWDVYQRLAYIILMNVSLGGPNT